MSAPPDFDEAAYLEANPDVRAAVEGGEFPSGRAHYEAFGQEEGRKLQRTRSSREKLLDGIDLAREEGLEIGPLTNPIVRKSDGNILYVDRADTEELRARYGGTHVDLASIVPVDAVWGENTLAGCLGAGRMVDYVVNAHVVEHVPDLVTWLAEIRAILRPGGRLRMVIPDRRYTFDVLRRESTLPEVLDAYLRRARTPLPRAILDHVMHAVNDVEARALWAGSVDIAALRPSSTAEHALELARNALATGFYQDVHCWVFTPRSFAGLCGALARLGLLGFRCERIDPTEPGANEFVAALLPGEDPAAIAESWDRAGDALP